MVADLETKVIDIGLGYGEDASSSPDQAAGGRRAVYVTHVSNGVAPAHNIVPVTNTPEIGAWARIVGRSNGIDVGSIMVNSLSGRKTVDNLGNYGDLGVAVAEHVERLSVAAGDDFFTIGFTSYSADAIPAAIVSDKDFRCGAVVFRYDHNGARNVQSYMSDTWVDALVVHNDADPNNSVMISRNYDGMVQVLTIQLSGAVVLQYTAVIDSPDLYPINLNALFPNLMAACFVTPTTMKLALITASAECLLFDIDLTANTMVPTPGFGSQPVSGFCYHPAVVHESGITHVWMPSAGGCRLSVHDGTSWSHLGVVIASDGPYAVPVSAKYVPSAGYFGVLTASVDPNDIAETRADLFYVAASGSLHNRGIQLRMPAVGLGIHPRGGALFGYSPTPYGSYTPYIDIDWLGELVLPAPAPSAVSYVKNPEYTNADPSRALARIGTNEHKLAIYMPFIAENIACVGRNVIIPYVKSITGQRSVVCVWQGDWLRDPPAVDGGQYLADTMLSKPVARDWFINRVGWLSSPRIISTTTYAGTAHGAPPGMYVFRIVYVSLDVSGYDIRSAPSDAVYINVASGTDYPVLVFSIPAGVSVEVYMTEANGSVFALVWTSSRDPYATRYGYVHEQNPAYARGELLYTTGGKLENDVLPAVTAACVHGNRLFVTDGTVVRYSQEALEYAVPEFPSALAINVGLVETPIERLASCGEYLLLFSRNNVYAVGGQGPDMTGNPASGSFSNPERVLTGHGATLQSALVETPDGVLFYDQNSSRVMQLSKSLELSVPGEAVARVSRDQIVTQPSPGSLVHDRFISGAYSPHIQSAIFIGESGIYYIYNVLYGRWSQSDVSSRFRSVWVTADATYLIGVVYQPFKLDVTQWRTDWSLFDIPRVAPPNRNSWLRIRTITILGQTTAKLASNATVRLIVRAFDARADRYTTRAYEWTLYDRGGDEPIVLHADYAGQPCTYADMTLVFRGGAIELSRVQVAYVETMADVGRGMLPANIETLVDNAG